MAFFFSFIASFQPSHNGCEGFATLLRTICNQAASNLEIGRCKTKFGYSCRRNRKTKPIPGIHDPLYSRSPVVAVDRLDGVHATDICPNHWSSSGTSA